MGEGIINQNKSTWELLHRLVNSKSLPIGHHYVSIGTFDHAYRHISYMNPKIQPYRYLECIVDEEYPKAIRSSKCLSL